MIELAKEENLRVSPELLEAERRRKEKAKAMASQFRPPIPQDEAFEKELAAACERFTQAYRDHRENPLSPEAFDHSEKIRAIVSEMNLPKRHASTHELDYSGEWGAKLSKLKAMIGKGFLAALIGTWGNGKTQFAVEMLKYAANDSRSGLFTTATDFFMDIKESYRDKASHSEKDVITKYCKPSLLVVDEQSEVMPTR